MHPILKDSDWVRQSFLVAKKDLEPQDYANRIYSSVALKFTDTTPGGNFAINPPPQFTSTADIRGESSFSGSKGMGRYYSEAIDDNSQIIHMRFGVPEFNSLTTFFNSFYDSGAGQLARSGRSHGLFYKAGQAVGFVVSFATIGLVAIHLAGLALRFATEKPSSKFYYLKPTMPLYWNAVNTMVNHIAVNRGIVPRLFGPDKNNFYNDYEFDKDALTKLSNLLPEIFNRGGGIDVYSMAGRAQRLARQRHLKIEEVMNAGKRESMATAIQEALTEDMQDTNKREYKNYLQRFFDHVGSQPIDDGTNTTVAQATANNATTPPTKDSSSTTEGKPTTHDAVAGFLDFFMSELNDGSAFASFRVNSTGHASESFGNNVGESELASKINGYTSQARTTSFNFAGGNLDSGFIGKAAGAVANSFKEFAEGAADGLHLSGLAALGGSAFVDIPKHWQSSTASLPRANYTIRLTSPYGNPISQLINLHIPLAMLLAGALPLSTGKQSYTSPFLVELYDKGRCQVKLGMIDSLSITRGTGNLGYNNEGHAMGIDVSFSVIDMSSVLSMPITEGFSMDGLNTGLSLGAIAGGIEGAALGASVGGIPGAVVGGVAGTFVGTATVGVGLGAAGAVIDAASNAMKSINNVFDDDNAFSDYMAVLAGMNLTDQIYAFNKIKLRLTQTMVDWKQW